MGGRRLGGRRLRPAGKVWGMPPRSEPPRGRWFRDRQAGRSRGGAAAPPRTRTGGPSDRSHPPAGEGVPRGVAEEIRRAARTGQADRALRAFQRAVGLLERDRDAAAVSAASEAKELAGRSGAVREVLGMALYRSGRYREALRELQAYRRMTGRVDQNHLIADSHRALGQPEKAVDAARETLRQRTLPPEVRAEAAVVGAGALADLGRFPEAVAMLRGFPTDARRAARG